MAQNMEEGVKEKPILFSGSMVRAILDGRKTQTRRLVTPAAGRQSTWLDIDLLSRSPRAKMAVLDDGRNGAQFAHPLAGQTIDGLVHDEWSPLGWVPCPYGAAGDHLWVKETFAPADRWADGYDRDDPTLVAYAADGKVLNVEDGADKWLYDGWEHYMHWHALKERKWKPSIFMPRWASRITLRVTGVRVERLQAITRADARAEGVTSLDAYHDYLDHADAIGVGTGDAEQKVFASLWDSINGHRAPWDSDPWVWVINFERVTK